MVKKEIENENDRKEVDKAGVIEKQSVKIKKESRTNRNEKEVNRNGNE